MNQELRGNQFPLQPHHFNALRQVRGDEFAGRVAVMAQTYSKDGGCNPNAVNMVFPDGSDGLVDEVALAVVLKNFAAWHDID